MTSSSTAAIASWRASFSATWVASSSFAPCEPLIESISSSSTCGTSTSRFGLPAFWASSSKTATIFLISPWAMSRASSTSASVTNFAPHSTIRIASSVPETTRSMSRSSQFSSEGLTTKSPSSLPIRTAPTCFGSGMSETAIAAEAPFIARMS